MAYNTSWGGFFPMGACVHWKLKTNYYKLSLLPAPPECVFRAFQVNSNRD